MLRVWDYACVTPGCCKETIRREVFIKGPPPELAGECVACAQPLAKQLTSPRFKLEGITGDYPSAADKWAIQHEEAARVAKRKNRDKVVYETEQGER